MGYSSSTTTIGLTGQAIYSTDGGNTWLRPTTFPSSVVCNSVAFGNGTFVTVGYTSSSPGSGRAIYSTDDGKSWLTPTTFPSSALCNSVAFGNGTFVTVGYGTAAYSP